MPAIAHANFSRLIELFRAVTFFPVSTDTNRRDNLIYLPSARHTSVAVVFEVVGEPRHRLLDDAGQDWASGYSEEQFASGMIRMTDQFGAGIFVEARRVQEGWEVKYALGGAELFAHALYRSHIIPINPT